MQRIFQRINPAPLEVQVQSRESLIYLYRFIKFIGWIPPKQGKRLYFYLLWTYFVYAIILIYHPIGLSLTLILDFKSFTPSEFLKVLQVTINVIGATTKCFILRMSFKSLGATESLLDKLDKFLKGASDHTKIHQAVANCNYIILLYSMSYAGYAWCEIFVSFLNKQPPWMIHNPFFDWRDGNIQLWLQTLLECSTGMTEVVVLLLNDTYAIVYMLIIRAHVGVLKNHISNLCTDPLKTQAENYDDLVNCIIYHKMILKCCNLMRPVVSRTTFVQFLIIGALLGLTMLNIWFFADFWRAISFTLYLAALFLQTFPFCYLCDCVSEDSNDLNHLLIQSEWINAEPKYKTTLKIFMHHVQQPIMFTAGGILPISVRSNIQVAKFAFTVITIVQQMDLADRFK